MSKTLKKVVTLVLVLVMLFSMSAFTIDAAAADIATRSSGAGNNVSLGGNGAAQNAGSESLVTGWFNITYDKDENKITVELVPDKGAILGVSAAQLKEIASMLVEAIKEVALDDILDPFGGIGVLSQDINSDNVWEIALNAYLDDRYPEESDKRMAFIKEVLDPTAVGDTTVGNLGIADFADYVASLLRVAILVKPEILSVLPGAEDINSFIEEALERILYEEIGKYLKEIVEDYIIYAQLENKAEYNESTDYDLIVKVEDYMHTIVKDEVDKYVTNLSKLPQNDSSATLDSLEEHLQAMQNDVVYMYLANYIDDEITSLKNKLTSYVDSYITARLSGVTPPSPDSEILKYVPNAEDKISNKIENEVERLVRTYLAKKIDPSAETFDGYDYFEQFIDSFVNSAISKIVNNYIVEKTGEGEFADVIGMDEELYSSIKTRVDGIFNEELEKNLSDYKAFMNREPGAVKPDFYETIKAHLIEKIADEYDFSYEDAVSAYESWENGDLDYDYSDTLSEITVEDIIPTRSNFESALLGASLDSVLNRVFESLSIEDVLDGIDNDEILKTVGSSDEGGDLDQKIAELKNLTGATTLFEELGSLTPERRIEIIEKKLPGITAPSGTLTTEQKDALNAAIDSIAADVISYISAAGDLSELAEELTDFSLDMLETGEFDDYIGEAIGTDYKVGIDSVHETMHNISDKVGTKYSETIRDLENVTDTKTRLAEILKLFTDARVDFNKNGELEAHESFLVRDDNGVRFDFQKIIEIINFLPTIDELATMSPEEMNLTCKIGIETILGNNNLNDGLDTEFTVVVKLGGGYDEVNRVFSFITRYLDIEYDENGLLSRFNIIIPDEFAHAILKLCNTNRIPAALKDKVFEAIVETPEGVHTFIKNFTIEDIKALLDTINSKADLDGIITKQVVSRFESLEGFSVKQVEEKIDEYKGYYLKLISLFNRAYAFYSSTPIAPKLEEGILGLYQDDSEDGAPGLATFAINFAEEITLPSFAYTVISKVDADRAQQVANIIDAIFANTYLDIDFTFSLQFADIYKVSYAIDIEGEPEPVKKEGFLPAGADILTFAPFNEYGGAPIIAWKDANGTVHDTMPKADTVLYPVYAQAGDALIKLDGQAMTSFTKIYDGNTVVLQAFVFGLQEQTVTYQWYKDDVKIEGATSSEYSVTNVADTGVYRCEISVQYPSETEIKSAEIDVTITKKIIDLSNLGITWTGGDFVYGDPNISVSLNEDSIPDELVILQGLRGDLTATDVGEYTAYADFTLVDPDNHAFNDGVSFIEYPWSVAKSEYSDISFFVNGESVNSVIYTNGVTHLVSAVIPGAPDGIFNVELTGYYFATDAGVYQAYATVTVNEANPNAYRYAWAGPQTVTFEWTVSPREIDLSEYVWGAYANGVLLPDTNFTFTYNSGTEISILLKDVPEDIANILVYSNNVSTDVTDGTLIATATLDTEHSDYGTVIGNYSFFTVDLGAGPEIKLPAGREWMIVPKTLDLGNVSWPAQNEYDYDGEPKPIVLEGTLSEEAEGKIVYEYYVFDGSNYVLIFGAPTEVGSYKVVFKLSDEYANNYLLPSEPESFFFFDIKEVRTTIDTTVETDYTNPFTYNGSDRFVNLTYSELQRYLELGIVSISVSGNSAKNAGSYTVILTATILEEYRNSYVFENNSYTYTYSHDWSIKKAQIDITDIGWQNGGSIFTWSGALFGVELIGITENIAALLNIEYVQGSILSATEPGSYDAGVVLTIIDADNYEFVLNDNTLQQNSILMDCNWTIVKAVIDLGVLDWIVPTSPIYNGSAHTAHPYLDLSGISQETLNLISVTYGRDVSAINAGSYVVSVTVTANDTAHYTLSYTLMANEYAWSILKATYDTSDLRFDDKTVKYDGNPHKIEVVGIPDGVTVTYSRDNTAIEPGRYEITASFSGDSNYNPIPDMTAVLLIQPADTPDEPIIPDPTYRYEYSYLDWVIIRSKVPFIGDHVLDVINTARYNDLDLDGLFGVGKFARIVETWDIYFTKDGVSVSGDLLEVRILLPESMRSSKNDFGILYLANADGSSPQIIESERDGDYIVFYTTHFSLYAIAEISDSPIAGIEKPSEEPKQSKISPILLLLIVVILLFVLLLFLMFRRGGNTHGDKIRGGAYSSARSLNSYRGRVGSDDGYREPTMQTYHYDRKEPYAAPIIINAPSASVADDIPITVEHEIAADALARSTSSIFGQSATSTKKNTKRKSKKNAESELKIRKAQRRIFALNGEYVTEPKMVPFEMTSGVDKSRAAMAAAAKSQIVISDELESTTYDINQNAKALTAKEKKIKKSKDIDFNMASELKARKAIRKSRMLGSEYVEEPVMNLLHESTPHDVAVSRKNSSVPKKDRVFDSNDEYAAYALNENTRTLSAKAKKTKQSDDDGFSMASELKARKAIRKSRMLGSEYVEEPVMNLLYDGAAPIASTAANVQPTDKEEPIFVSDGYEFAAYALGRTASSVSAKSKTAKTSKKNAAVAAFAAKAHKADRRGETASTNVEEPTMYSYYDESEPIVPISRSSAPVPTEEPITVSPDHELSAYELERNVGMLSAKTSKKNRGSLASDIEARKAERRSRMISADAVEEPTMYSYYDESAPIVPISHSSAPVHGEEPITVSPDHELSAYELERNTIALSAKTSKKNSRSRISEIEARKAERKRGCVMAKSIAEPRIEPIESESYSVQADAKKKAKVTAVTEKKPQTISEKLRSLPSGFYPSNDPVIQGLPDDLNLILSIPARKAVVKTADAEAKPIDKNISEADEKAKNTAAESIEQNDEFTDEYEEEINVIHEKLNSLMGSSDGEEKSAPRSVRSYNNTEVVTIEKQPEQDVRMPEFTAVGVDDREYETGEEKSYRESLSRTLEEDVGELHKNLNSVMGVSDDYEKPSFRDSYSLNRDDVANPDKRTDSEARMPVIAAVAATEKRRNYKVDDETYDEELLSNEIEEDVGELQKSLDSFMSATDGVEKMSFRDTYRAGRADAAKPEKPADSEARMPVIAAVAATEKRRDYKVDDEIYDRELLSDEIEEDVGDLQKSLDSFIGATGGVEKMSFRDTYRAGRADAAKPEKPTYSEARMPVIAAVAATDKRRDYKVDDEIYDRELLSDEIEEDVGDLQKSLDSFIGVTGEPEKSSFRETYRVIRADEVSAEKPTAAEARMPAFAVVDTTREEYETAEESSQSSSLYSEHNEDIGDLQKNIDSMFTKSTATSDKRAVSYAKDRKISAESLSEPRMDSMYDSEYNLSSEEAGAPYVFTEAPVRNAEKITDVLPDATEDFLASDDSVEYENAIGRLNEKVDSMMEEPREVVKSRRDLDEEEPSYTEAKKEKTEKASKKSRRTPVVIPVGAPTLEKADVMPEENEAAESYSETATELKDSVDTVLTDSELKAESEEKMLEEEIISATENAADDVVENAASEKSADVSLGAAPLAAATLAAASLAAAPLAEKAVSEESVDTKPAIVAAVAAAAAAGAEAKAPAAKPAQDALELPDQPLSPASPRVIIRNVSDNGRSAVKVKPVISPLSVKSNDVKAEAPAVQEEEQIPEPTVEPIEEKQEPKQPINLEAKRIVLSFNKEGGVTVGSKDPQNNSDKLEKLSNPERIVVRINKDSSAD